jgi:GT2 family glycosyltransferase
VLLNNDILPLTGWLEALERYADQHPRAGIVGARLLWPDRTVQHAGIVVGPGGFLHHLYVGMPGDHPAVCRSRRLRMVTGAAMLIRRELWDELGGLDTGFHDSFEDVDLCLRAGQLGHEVHVCGDAVLMHLESASSVGASSSPTISASTLRTVFSAQTTSPAESRSRSIPHWPDRQPTIRAL